MARKKHPINQMCEPCRALSFQILERLGASPDHAVGFASALRVMDLEHEVDRLKMELEWAKESAEQWERWATMGVVEPHRLWMESEVWKAALQPSPGKVRRCYADLVKATRKWFEEGNS